MRIAAKSPHQQDTVSAATVSFLGELALLPAIQQGDLDSVAELVCERAVKLVDARYISIWMLTPERTCLRSIVRFDGATGERCQNKSTSPSSTSATNSQPFSNPRRARRDC